MAPERWDHSTREGFFTYYAAQSQRAETAERLARLRDTVLRALGGHPGPLDVADLGCGAGAQSLAWAALGHRVRGLDVSERLVALAKERAEAAGLRVDFSVGSVSRLPWPDASMDVCLAVELLEHVPDWRACLDEATRVLRPGGVAFVTTTNVLCPKQQEFALPLYSWYPRPLKRRYERLAVTTRPDLVTHATYPAVNWFTFYRLRRELAARGCRSLDRFDLADGAGKGTLARLTLRAIRTLPPLRWLAYVVTPSTWVLATKGPAGTRA
jgi:2-polyprenyl-6-hydroxyphenyl methylase/3-demethylubiquinone-9 3-methyltransferase